MRTIGHAPRIGFALVAGITTTALGQGGDDPATAVPIGLNTPATGTTVGYTNVSDETCPYTGSTSPDVYYSYTPTTRHNLTVEICNSGYDSKVYVYDSTLNLITDINGNISCDDDSCSSSGGGAFRSIVHCVPVAAGATYYAIVDGWGGDSGPYAISLADTEIVLGDPDACVELPPCIFEWCDPDHILEGEPCNEGQDDCFNGGCNCTGGDPLLAFKEICCEKPICGVGYFNGTLRNTDWYRYDSRTGGDFRWQVVAEFEAVIGRVENGGVHDCTGVVAFAEVVVGSAGCEELYTETFDEVPPGTYWFWVGCNFTANVLCSVPQEEPGSDYIAELLCNFSLPPCPWDFDHNMEVDFGDLLELLANWGPCPMVGGRPLPCPWDFNGSGEVEFQDLLKQLANWGPCPGACVLNDD